MPPSGWTNAKRAFVAPISPISPTSGMFIKMASGAVSFTKVFALMTLTARRTPVSKWICVNESGRAVGNVTFHDVSM